MDKKYKLNGKDLITIGIYTAIIFVVTLAVAMIMFFPFLIPVMFVLSPVLVGIPFMLYLTKVKKPGMVFITGMIIGLVMWLTGMGPYIFLINFVTGAVAELLLWSGKYQSSWKAIFAYAVYSLSGMGSYIPMFFSFDSFSASRQDFGENYLNEIQKFAQVKFFPIIIVVCFVSCIIGGLLGRAMLKKHFAKAGIV